MLKVAYDATVLINEAGQSDRKSGIFRETEEIMKELHRRSDIDLTLVKLCNMGHEIFDALGFSTCIKREPDWAELKTADILGSRFNLRSWQEKLFEITFSEEWKQVPKTSPKAVLARAAFKVLREIDAYSYFDYEKFDIFHSTYHKLPPESITHSLPRVLTIQDLIPVISPELVSPSLTTYFNQILDSINKEKDWIICISEYTKQEFCEFTGMSPDRVFITPLAAASHFKPVKDSIQIGGVRQRYGIPEGNYFLSLATFLAPHKNLKHLIHCFFQLLSEQPELDVNLVLAGSKRATLGEMIEEQYKELSSRVIYTGYVADEDLSALYSGATAFIFPSLYEGFGLPPLEAMSCGTPVITSNKTSLPEVVGDAGIMVDPKDENQLCQAMLNLLKDEALVQDLRLRGFEQSKRFSWSKCTADTVAVYRKVLNCS
jgi:glycosyltransferase involved in cell wall biosynthesis